MAITFLVTELAMRHGVGVGGWRQPAAPAAAQGRVTKYLNGTPPTWPPREGCTA